MSNAERRGLDETLELSLYELHRTPQDKIVDDTEVAVCPRGLNNEFKCPICLDILKNTMTAKDCLHRFCAECIIKALRLGNKECPTCKKKLISKRSLRPDTRFDMLVAKMFCVEDTFVQNEQKVLAELNKADLQVYLKNRDKKN